MSSWAERFAALSRAYDNVDNIDTVAAEADQTSPEGHSVSHCQRCHDSSGAAPSFTKAAETLGSAVHDLHSVNIVNSVTVGIGAEGQRGGRGLDELSTTVLTVHDNVEPKDVFRLSPDSADNLEERAALIEEGAGVPRAWAEGYAALSSMPVPTGFSPERWRRVVDAAGDFLDKWTDTALACGWSDLDIFGCHSTRPDARFDAMGLVLLLGRCCEVVSIDEHGADLITDTGTHQRFRRRPMPPGTISLWELAPTVLR